MSKIVNKELIPEKKTMMRLCGYKLKARLKSTVDTPKDVKLTDFYKQYDMIKEMRSKRDAPVDSMGAECCPDANEEPKVFRYQALISLMLSSQTKDEITSRTMKALKEYGLTPQHIHETSEERLDELIKSVGFHKKKAAYIKSTTKILIEDYDGDIPDTVEGLCALPGVGLKMAHLTLKIAWKKVLGIGVDVHVHRICNRLHWVQTNTAEKTRLALESWLPQELWSEINQILVGFGQQICKSKPRCEDCTLRNVCPSSNCRDIEDL